MQIVAILHEVARRVEVLARDHEGDDGFLALVFNLDAALVDGEEGFDAEGVELVVDDGAVVNVSHAVGCCLALDDEEIFQGLTGVERRREVGQVVTKLHRLVVHAVGPTSEHRGLSIFAAVAVA